MRLRPDHWALRWSVLFNLRSNPLLKISSFGIIFIPILANTILVLRHLYPRATSEMSWLRIPHGVASTFFLSVSIAISNIIVDALCPELIRRHRDQDTFEVEAVSHNVRLNQLRGFLKESLSEQFQKRVDGVISGGQATAPMVEAFRDQDVRDWLSLTVSDAVISATAGPLEAPRQIKDWHDNDGSRPFSRGAATVFYVIAAILGIYLGLFSAFVRVIETI